MAGSDGSVDLVWIVDWESTTHIDRLWSPAQLYCSDQTVLGMIRMQSTGRRGIGNVRQASLSRDARPSSGPDDFSVTRRRELVANANYIVIDWPFSTGRDRAGDIIPGGAPVAESMDEEERRKHMHHTTGLYRHSAGDGGTANSSSTHARAVQHHSHHAAEFESTGRGGVRNIVPERSSPRHRT
ncbi:hypothetical protein BDZ97DRAFT_1917483 [Flammula alnicola]|nr:hypothetical protein BDZ97DRAFT_1917483 [Flammula alnicola]